MKSYFIMILFILLSTIPSWSQTTLGDSEMGSVITAPSIRSRCEELLKKRNIFILNKQKLSALEVRTEKVTKKISEEDDYETHLKFKRNLGRVRHELALVRTKIENLEEAIVRKGCPGMAL